MDFVAFLEMPKLSLILDRLVKDVVSPNERFFKTTVLTLSALVMVYIH